MINRKVLYRVFAILTALVLAIVAIAIYYSETGLMFRQEVAYSCFRHVPCAEYDGMYVFGLQSMDSISCQEPPCFERIYVELPSGEVSSLSALQSDDLVPPLTSIGRLGSRYEWFDDPTSKAAFDSNGQLTYLKMHARSNFFRIGNSPDGPFYDLPITRQQMYELFGRPHRWSHYTIRGV